MGTGDGGRDEEGDDEDPSCPRVIAAIHLAYSHWYWLEQLKIRREDFIFFITGIANNEKTNKLFVGLKSDTTKKIFCSIRPHQHYPVRDDSVQWKTEKKGSVADLCHVDFRPGDVGELWTRLNEDLGEVVIIVASGNHVETHQNVEWQSEHGQIPSAVYGCQGTGHNRTETQQHITSFMKQTQVHDEHAFCC